MKFLNNKTSEQFVSEIMILLNLQKEMNDSVNINWKDEPDYDFSFAALMECNEAVDCHFNWKWWAKGKEEKEDKYQLFLENVDIFHFILSSFAVFLKNDSGSEKSVEDGEKEFFEEMYDSLSSEESNGLDIIFKNVSIFQLYKILIYALSNNSLTFNFKFLGSELNEDSLTYDSGSQFYLLFSIIEKLGFTFDDLAKWYVAKNALNIFRQDKGYKTGEYDRGWAVRKGFKDDNDILEFITRCHIKENKIIDIIEFKKAIYKDLTIAFDNTTKCVDYLNCV